MSPRNPKIVFIAQTPPPYLGQSIMHQFMINADWNGLRKKHIRLNMSDKSDQFGVISIKKILSIIRVILSFWIERIRGTIDILYYPPSGPVSRKTFYKDLSLLLFTRFLASKTVFHFHADRFDALLNKLNRIELWFAGIIYSKPDLCIVMLAPQKQDVYWLKPDRIEIVPNGIEDRFISEAPVSGRNSFNILYIGLLVPYKGIEYALKCANILKSKKLNFRWTFVGGWSSDGFREMMLSLVEEFGLQAEIEFAGEKIDDERWEYFREADVLCLPTYNDLMPLCVLEGMMMSLPVVTTTIRTLSYIVDDKINGLLSPVRDPEKMAENLEYLYNNRDICRKMGQNGREKFEKQYSIDKHLKLMQETVCKILQKTNEY